MHQLSRRNFISVGASLAVCAAGAGTTTQTMAKKPTAKNPTPQTPAQPPRALIDSAPVLQNAAATSIGVVFTVTSDASGWVEYATTPDLKNATRAYSGEQGMMDISERVVKVRITAHQHRFRYDAPTPTRPWAQIVGGGNGEKLTWRDFPTVIEGKVVKDQLVVRVFDTLRGTLAKELTFHA